MHWRQHLRICVSSAVLYKGWRQAVVSDSHYAALLKLQEQHWCLYKNFIQWGKGTQVFKKKINCSSIWVTLFILFLKKSLSLVLLVCFLVHGFLLQLLCTYFVLRIESDFSSITYSSRNSCFMVAVTPCKTLIGKKNSSYCQSYCTSAVCTETQLHPTAYACCTNWHVLMFSSNRIIDICIRLWPQRKTIVYFHCNCWRQLYQIFWNN